MDATGAAALGLDNEVYSTYAVCYAGLNKAVYRQGGHKLDKDEKGGIVPRFGQPFCCWSLGGAVMTVAYCAPRTMELALLHI